MVSNTVGRPTVLTDNVLSKLKAVLQRGLSTKKACVYAGIGEKTFYRNYNNDSEFRQFIDDCRDFATVIAGEVVVDDIVDKRNVSTAKWWLERKDPEEFANKSIVGQITQRKSYEFISDEEFIARAERAGIPQIDPLAIAKALTSRP